MQYCYGVLVVLCSCNWASPQYHDGHVVLSKSAIGNCTVVHTVLEHDSASPCAPLRAPQVLASNHDWQLTLAPPGPHGLDTIVESAGEGATPGPTDRSSEGEGGHAPGGPFEEEGEREGAEGGRSGVGAQGTGSGAPEADRGPAVPDSSSSNVAVFGSLADVDEIFRVVLRTGKPFVGHKGAPPPGLGAPLSTVQSAEAEATSDGALNTNDASGGNSGAEAVVATEPDSVPASGGSSLGGVSSALAVPLFFGMTLCLQH